MRKILFAFALIFLIGAVVVGSYERYLRTTFFINEIASSANVIGTPPRLEKEYKISITPPQKERPQFLNTALSNILQKLAQKSDWKAPSFYKKNYFITSTEDTFVFRDIYFDTDDRLLERNQSSIRLRWRWDSEKSYREYLKGTFSRPSVPTRVEIQSKVGRTMTAQGLSEVYESRMEFSKDAHPIKSYILEGRARLLLPLFIETIKTGRFESQVHTAAQSIAKKISRSAPRASSLQLIPQLVILARRHRFHLNLVTPWGSGPNPHNAFIITVDRFKGLPLPASSRWEHEISRLDFSKASESIELEVEFERNTSTLLEQEIEKLQKLGVRDDLVSVQKIQSYFEDDHKRLAFEIIKHLENEGYKLDLKNFSKPQSIQQNIDNSSD